MVGAALIYDARMSAKRRAAALRELRLERARVLRQTTEAHLQAMRARMDPQFLFDTLASVERTYERESAAGDRLLESLIDYLRAALPDLRGTTSTVGKEFDLTRSWFELQKSLGRTLNCTIEAPDAIRGASFPSMIIVPLVETLLPEPDESAAITLLATQGDSRLAVTLRTSATSTTPKSTEEVRARLGDLYGDAASLAVAPNGEITLEIPYEAEGDHR